MKSGICIALMLFLVGCQSYLTYEELEEQAPNDPKIQKRLERFERNVALAFAYQDLVAACEEGYTCMQVCVNLPSGQKYDPARIDFDDLDDFVRWYRVIRGSCSFLVGR